MRRSKYTRPAWLGEQGEGGQGTADKPRLTTSAMIASLAGADQRTKPAPFGHALAALAESRPDIVGLRRTSPSTRTCTSLRRLTPIISTRWAWRNSS